METKCYVGTYAKYNNGSIDGKWLNLAEFATFSDFLAACKKVHKDESDPEFMIQDWESLPDGFPSVEWIGESDFNDIKEAMKEDDEENEPQAQGNIQIIDYSEKAFAVVGDTKAVKDDLKKLGGRFNPKLSCGAGWIFSKKALSDVEAFLKSGSVAKGGKSVASGKNTDKVDKTTPIWGKYRELINKRGPYPELTEETIKVTDDLVELSDGLIFVLKKESIEVDFCWADEGPDYENYKKVTSSEESLKRYFIWENTRKIDDHIKRLKTLKDRYDNELTPVCFECCWSRDNEPIGYSSDLRELSGVDYYREKQDKRNGIIHELTADDVKKVTKALERFRARFQKRLDTYLKRYGVSKLHTWTYWADR